MKTMLGRPFSAAARAGGTAPSASTRTTDARRNEERQFAAGIEFIGVILGELNVYTSSRKSPSGKRDGDAGAQKLNEFVMDQLRSGGMRNVAHDPSGLEAMGTSCSLAAKLRTLRLMFQAMVAPRSLNRFL